MRGFKVDRQQTELLERLDKRTFVSQPKPLGHSNWKELPDQHIIAYGKDKIRIRAEIFKRNAAANGNTYRCAECGKELVEDAAIGDPCRGEWHHLNNKPGMRCDCPENGRVLCRGCHVKRHPRIMSGKVNA
jgi:DNA-directed RNA polymerase subunit RPC12/RpoP